MEPVAKYKLSYVKHFGENNQYTKYAIEGLVNAYYKVRERQETFGGVCGLLKSGKYEGYCYLCETYTKTELYEIPEPGVTIEFSPLLNEKGERILIEWPYDVRILFIDRGYTEYDNGTVKYATLDFAEKVNLPFEEE